MKNPYQYSRKAVDYRFRDDNFPIMVQYADEKHPTVVENRDQIRAGVRFDVLKLKVQPS